MLNQCALYPGPQPGWPLPLGQGPSPETCLHYSCLTSIYWVFKVDLPLPFRGIVSLVRPNGANVWHHVLSDEWPNRP